MARGSLAFAMGALGLAFRSGRSGASIAEVSDSWMKWRLLLCSDNVAKAGGRRQASD